MCFSDPKNVLSYVKIPYGAKVADFGAGSGQYALAAAERLEGGGTVYALDAFRPSLESLAKEAGRRNLNLYTLHSDLNAHIPFKDNLLRLGIAANILHQLENRKRFVEELARVVAPGGEVLVVDWVSSFKNMGPTEERAITPGEAAALFREAGFTPGEMLPAGTHHFAFVATL